MQRELCRLGYSSGIVLALKIYHMCTLALVTGINKEGNMIFQNTKKKKQGENGVE